LLKWDNFSAFERGMDDESIKFPEISWDIIPVILLSYREEKYASYAIKIGAADAGVVSIANGPDLAEEKNKKL